MKKYIIIALIALILVAGIVGFRFYSFIFSPNVDINGDRTYILIPSEASLESVLDTLINRKIVKDVKSFEWVAKKMSYLDPKPGRFLIDNNWSNKQLISVLRSGTQNAVEITFNNVRTIEELCDIFGAALEADAESFRSYFLDTETLNRYECTKETVISLFVPNTYQIYWNTSPKNLIERMKKEHDKFWNSERQQKLIDLELTRNEAYTLASIVQKESNLKSEKPRIAGVYYNRFKKGILLQADPTVIFAVGDFEIRRVLYRHLEFDSPYNTYKYQGLPPGPICMPDINTIDDVLNLEKHDYIYFCVSPDNKLEHAFAKTLSQHNANAKKYRNWLNQQKIYN